MSKFEEDKLFCYLLEASSPQEAHWFRFLDCTAFLQRRTLFLLLGRGKEVRYSRFVKYIISSRFLSHSAFVVALLS